MEPYAITVYPTYITVPCDQLGYTPDNCRIKRSCDALTHKVYNNHGGLESTTIYTVYDTANELRRFPRHTLGMVTKELTEQRSNFKIISGPTVPTCTIDIPINPNWHERDYQVSSLEFLSDKTKSMKLLGLQTGKGKSDLAIKIICDHSEPSIIILGEGLDQWRERILSNTLLANDDVYTIQSEKSLATLFCNPQLYPKIFLISIATLRNWIFAPADSTYKNFPTWTQFLHMYKISKKFTDEIHRKMLTNTLIDLMTEVADNNYLSATPMRTVKREDLIFSLIFPEDIRFDGPDYHKYVDIFFYYYKLHTNKKSSAFRTMKGYSQQKYETTIVKNRHLLSDFVDMVLCKIIDKHFVAKQKLGQKCLILAEKKDTVFELKNILSKRYPDLIVDRYVGGTNRSVLAGSDIIVATHKSASTALDIKNLLTCINVVSFNSQVTAEQMLGRLRELFDGSIPELIDMCNVVLHDHIRHAQRRTAIYKELGLTLTEVELQ